MNENITNDVELEIDIFELFRMLLKKWWLIVICAIVGAVAMMSITSFLITPMYQSQAMLYILNKTTSVTSIADIQIGSALTADFEVIAKSKPVIDGAIEKIRREEGKEFDRSDVLDSLEISNAEDTRILIISATCEDPEDACIIANAVASETATQMAQIMKSDPPTTVENAEISDAPVSPSMIKNTVLGFLIGALLVCAVLVIRFILNDNIKTEEQVTKYLGVPTLAVIPFIKEKDYKKEELKRQKEELNAK